MMLRVKTMGAGRAGAWGFGAMLLAGAVILGGTQARAQGKIGPAAPVTYDNRYDLYGGLSFMNFQAGQNLPTRMNMGGAEVQGTYWATQRFGFGADVRGEFGTGPVFPNIYRVSRPLVSVLIGMGGVQVRGPRNQHAALNYHAYAGVAHGTFDQGTGGQPPEVFGLYTNRTRPIGAFGGSVDFNRSAKWAVRLSPDLIVEHFGTETREYFSISGGVVYRFGKKS